VTLLLADLRILDYMREILLVDWSERMGRTVDRFVESGNLALAA
jgi:hypothetical protein